ncbi:MAG: DHH family phosphoesterase [Patescibacteria group bacterium]
MISNIDKENFKKAWQRILSSDRILLVSHINPDVDAISSLGVFSDILKSLGKKYFSFAENKNDNYDYIPHAEDIISSKEELKNIINKNSELGDKYLEYFDLIITFDCGSLERTNLGSEIELFKNKFVIEIDHHVKVSSYADIEIKIQLASNTEILYYFLEENSIEINKNIANCILSGILTDTGNFLYPSVKNETLKISSRMLSLGAQFPKIVNNTLRNKNFSDMKVWAIVLENLRINEKYDIAFSFFTYEDFQNIEKMNLEISEDAFGLIVSFMSSLSEVSTVLLLKEEKMGEIKGNLRVGSTDKDVDVAYLASFLGGGGHKKAAGFMMKGSLIQENDTLRIV